MCQEPFAACEVAGRSASALSGSGASHCFEPHAACKSYTTGRGTKPIPQDISLGNNSDYHEFLKRAKVTPFAMPFYDLIVLTLDVPSCVHTMAMHSIRKNWITSYGPGRIFNALLFDDERFLPETSNDLRDLSSNGTMYTTQKAVAILGSFLFFSPFGQAIMNTTERIAAEPARFLDPCVRMQRFFYKCCELRKINSSHRWKWRQGYNSPALRQSMLDNLPIHLQDKVVRPCFEPRRIPQTPPAKKQKNM